MMSSMVLIDRWVSWIPENKTKLNTTDKVIRRLAIWKSLFEIDRCLVDIVTCGKQKNPPKAVSMLIYDGRGAPHQGKPPALKTGPCSLRGNVRQFFICQVSTASASMGGCSASGGKTISFIASTIEQVSAVSTLICDKQ